MQKDVKIQKNAKNAKKCKNAIGYPNDNSLVSSKIYQKCLQQWKWIKTIE